MQLALYDALVRHDNSGLYIVFTDDGAREVTDDRYDAFDTACGQKIRKGIEGAALTIRGYQCADPGDPLVSMWALAELANEHFGIQVGIIEPG